MEADETRNGWRCYESDRLAAYCDVLTIIYCYYDNVCIRRLEFMDNVIEFLFIVLGKGENAVSG